MCSNTCNSACGCGIGGSGAGSIWSSGLKKQQKRQRVPKRGPGVAELEKILREQESIDTTNNRGNTEGLSSPCFISHHPNSNSYHSSSLKSHPPAPPTSPKINLSSPGRASSNLLSHVPSIPKFDHLASSTPPTLNNMCGSFGPLGRNSGSGLGSLEKELFPVNINSSKSNLNEGVDGSQADSGNSPPQNLSNESNTIWSCPTTIQKRNNQYPLPMMNQFLGTGAPTSSGSLSIGLHNHLEPPSNQSSYYNYTSKASEEHTMVAKKRSYSSSLENSLIPPSNFHVLPSFSHYNRPHQSSINDSHGVSSFNSTKEFYRDAKWGSTAELSSTRFNSDIVAPGQANFPPFATPEVPSPPMHLFQGVLSKGNAFPCQVTEDKMDSHQRSESSGTDHRPFFNFLEVKDLVGVTETMRGTLRGGSEAGREGMDLSLKL